MELTINHKKKTFEINPESLAQVVHAESPVKKGIAVALNNQVVPREKWEETTVDENDTVLIIIASQGG